MKAHQRLIREAEAERDPRPIMTLEELRACRVGETPRERAAEIIHRYEWLATMGAASVCYGLETSAGELAGVVVFHKRALSTSDCEKARGHSNSFKLFKEPTPEWLQRGGYLIRGACVHWAHPHAGSFLISRACKAASEAYGWHVFFAYSDPMAGERGIIYRALNWHYLGQGLGRGDANTGRNVWTFAGDDQHPPQRFTTKALRGRLAKQRKNKCGEKIDRSARWPFVGNLANALNIGALRNVPGWTVEVCPDKCKYLHLEFPYSRRGRAQRREALALLRYPVQRYPNESDGLSEPPRAAARNPAARETP
jgi:hypothetical protein